MLNLLTSTLIAAGKDIPLGGFGELEKDSPYNQGSATKTGVVDNLVAFLSNLIGFFTVLAALFFVVYSFVAAFSWVTAAGDSGKIEKARNQLIQGVLGLIVIVAAYGIIELVGAIVGVEILNIEALLQSIVPT